LGLNYIITVLLFFFYVPYEQRYCDAKSESKNYHIKKRRRRCRSYGVETVSFWRKKTR